MTLGDANFSQRHARNHISQLIYLLWGVSSLGSPGPSPQQSLADIFAAWLPRHGGFRQGTHRNSGGQGEAILRVQGPHPLLGTEDMVTLGRIFLERDLGQDRNLRCWRSPRNTLDTPWAGRKPTPLPHDPGGASHSSGILQALELRACSKPPFSGIS